MSRAATLVIACLAMPVLASVARAQQPEPPPAQPPHNPPHGEPGHVHNPVEQGHLRPPAPLQKNLVPVPMSQVRIAPETFWDKRLQAVHTMALPAALAKLEAAGSIQNFAIAAGKASAERKGALYTDSDVYKVIEGAAYILSEYPDEALAARIDALVDTIAAAQQADGYLNTCHQVPTGGKVPAKWSDIAHGHELYCAGHLIEAGIAMKTATGKTKLLDVARKLADHIEKSFGPGKKLDPPGHAEIEIALCKLSEATGEAKYLALAKFFVDQRGNHTGRKSQGEYAQDHAPLRSQKAAVGHAVRAMYLYAGATDVARMAKDDTLLPPLEALWKDVVDTKMYVTGGIGVDKKSEGFGAAFELPNDTAYAETCASIGMALWGHRMLLATGDARYADVVDTQIHNAILGAISIKGDTFAYQNPLETNGDHPRQEWFDTACCPTNLVRFLPQLPGMIFATSGNSIYICQYVPCEAEFDVAGTKVKIKMQTDWAFSGRINLKIEPEKQMTFAVKLRRPGWCKEVAYQHDLKEQEHNAVFPGTEAGWETYERRYDPNDGANAHMLGPVRRVTAPAEVAADKGRVAIVRGPLVFALEGVDQQHKSAHALVLPETTTSFPVFDKPDKQITTVRAIKAKGQRVETGADGKPATKPAELIFVPYFLTGNRGKSDMLVWVPTTPDLATPSAQ
jgi:DUF1680 family protein